MLSIRQRLTFWYTLVLMVMLVAFAAAIFAGGSWQLQASTDRELLQAARLMADSLLNGDDPVAVDISYRLLRTDGQVVRASGLPARRVPIVAAALAAARVGQSSYDTVIVASLTGAGGGGQSGASSRLRVLTMPVGKPPAYILQIGKVEADIVRLRWLLVTLLLVALALGLPVAALGGWWLAGRALRPVAAMTETAQRIEAANLAERLPQPARDDELGRLAATLNGLLDRLQAAFLRERRFIADVSHDLRTPLALMKSTVGVALNRTRSAEELQDTLAELDAQIDRMTGLLEATLFLSRADADPATERRLAPLDLSTLLHDLCETTAPYAGEERKQVLTSDVAADLWVRGNRDQLTRLFLNLLDNAMQYTPAGGAIQVTGRAEAGRAVVDVTDNGVGIAAEDLSRVFDRFYRADKARSSAAADHHGLGLSIAQAIAHLHGGEITVKSALGKGSCFTVALPVAEPPHDRDG